ncbi:uncharacterized protein METZ01_LOCUS291218 [marine metagenome]|uniref:Uncharacterized protein n=1 Tax=marine metagenome TaxID=408172 RepID=A0A382LNJ0_9ZZZZ
MISLFFIAVLLEKVDVSSRYLKPKKD